MPDPAPLPTADACHWQVLSTLDLDTALAAVAGAPPALGNPLASSAAAGAPPALASSAAAGAPPALDAPETIPPSSQGAPKRPCTRAVLDGAAPNGQLMDAVVTMLHGSDDLVSAHLAQPRIALFSDVLEPGFRDSWHANPDGQPSFLRAASLDTTGQAYVRFGMREGAAILAIGSTLLPATTSRDSMARSISASGFTGGRVRLTFANTFRPTKPFTASAADIWPAGPASRIHSSAMDLTSGASGSTGLSAFDLSLLSLGEDEFHALQQTFVDAMPAVKTWRQPSDASGSTAAHYQAARANPDVGPMYSGAESHPSPAPDAATLDRRHRTGQELTAAARQLLHEQAGRGRVNVDDLFAPNTVFFRAGQAPGFHDSWNPDPRPDFLHALHVVGQAHQLGMREGAILLNVGRFSLPPGTSMNALRTAVRQGSWTGSV